MLFSVLRHATLLACAVLAAAPLGAQSRDSTKTDTPPIQDNSFLLEEAYNQEPRVVQHISGMLYQPASREWMYSFTQEWPVTGQRHQLSYTLSIAGVEGPRGVRRTRLGDALINYRYQLAGSGETRVAVAPRASVVLPTGDADLGVGRGSTGLQVDVPMSVVLSSRLATHSNAGFTVTPHARNDAGDRATTRDVNLGQSLIWLAHPRVNLMLEALWTRVETPIARGRVTHDESFLLSPGVRGAFNFTSGLQIVPGIAVPFELVATPRRASVFGYLSFEHPY